MSLLDDHVVAGEAETWALVDDPTEEVPLWWPEDQSERDPAFSP
jgi:hypothetical protein